ncbi:SDR family NAD(P)-dependent oxidoreductase [Amphritea pacifica]|uniref:SDR family NAD(P)-dependent oxidoreductase n=1 Tax=Amphritea pacifica TaxID=2811233 RepID=A0ABS2W725_9GAMM|nr:SDR family NAD(P)-dependent oxidoreductase [Amphritea pacifica]MBN0987511.1 SDR family NAD(P)-dependent oxidoreductase [Amphritea pacifica]
MSKANSTGRPRYPWKTAWVTGAGRGIGAELTRLLCRQGVTVYGSARTSEQLEQLQQALRGCEGELIPVPLDIRDADALQQLFLSWDAKGFMPELVVLNAGTHDPFSAYEFSAQRCKALLDINLQGTINCLEPVLYRYLGGDVPVSQAKPADAIKTSGSSGQIAVVSSSAGYRGLPTAAAYGAGKAALINLCEALRSDLQGSGVKLQLINPGFVRTPLTDKNDFSMPALMDADEAARRIVAGLLSDRFEIIFPRRFVYLLKLFRIIPYRWYFWLIGRATGAGKDVRNR